MTQATTRIKRCRLSQRVYTVDDASGWGVGVVQNTDRLFAVLVVLSGIGSTVLMAITLFSF